MTAARYHHTELPGGIRLAVATVGWSESAAFGIWVPAGSRDDPPGRAGLAHFVEHMAFKGTATRDARRISTEIEGHGGSINADTGEDHTCYEARAEAEMLPLLAEVVCDLVWNPTFPPQQVELEREVIREEIVLYQESPADHIGDLIARALWGPHPLGEPISGTLESLGRIRRRDLLEHAAAHHHRSDMVVAAAGPFEPEAVAGLVAALLPARAPRPPAPGRPFAPAGPPAAIREERDSAQAHLALGFHAPGRHSPQRHALRLLSLILGENSSSRLFQELRERRGLCYHVGTDVALLADTGALEVSIGLEPAQRNLALECIWRELDDLARHGPGDDELARAKRYAIGQGKIGFESTAAHLGWAAESLLHHGRIIEPAEARDAIRQVTAADVGQLAAAIFHRDHAVTAEIVPAGEPDEPETGGPGD